MAKRDLGSLQSQLAPIAATLPTQRPPEPPQLAVVKSPPAARAAAPAERPVQQAFALRPTLRKELHQLAARADMTVQQFVLAALRDKGLSVTEADLRDRRRNRA